MPLFSRITIIEAVDAFQFKTHSAISKFEFRFGIETKDNGIEPRVVEIIRYLIEHPLQKGPGGADLVFEIIEYLLEQKQEEITRKLRYHWDEEEEIFPKLVRSLKRDGYVIQDFKLVAMVPQELHLANKTSELEQLLLKHHFVTTKGHLDQAFSAFNRGEWAATNSQLRPFVESLFDEIAQNLNPSATVGARDSNARRELLATMTPAFFSSALNEWLGPGTGFVQGFWRRLHPNGPHPGLSDEDDSTFRLHLVMVVANHFLKRFDALI